VFNATNVAGKIVYLPGIAKTDFWAVLVELQNQGAIGVVLRAGSSKYYIKKNLNL
jgi:hypothetical protein